jgi:hypothetical protein
LIAHKSLGNGVNRVENEKLENARSGTSKEASKTRFRVLFAGRRRRHFAKCSKRAMN